MSVGQKLLSKVRKGACFSIGTDHLPKFPAVDREIGPAGGCSTELDGDRLTRSCRRGRIDAAPMHECAVRHQPGSNPLARVNPKNNRRGVDQALVDEVSNEDPQRLCLKRHFQ